MHGAWFGIPHVSDGASGEVCRATAGASVVPERCSCPSGGRRCGVPLARSDLHQGTVHQDGSQRAESLRLAQKRRGTGAVPEREEEAGTCLPALERAAAAGLDSLVASSAVRQQRG